MKSAVQRNKKIVNNTLLNAPFVGDQCRIKKRVVGATPRRRYLDAVYYMGSTTTVGEIPRTLPVIRALWVTSSELCKNASKTFRPIIVTTKCILSHEMPKNDFAHLKSFKIR